MFKHWNDFQLEKSISPMFDVWIWLWNEYQCDFNKKAIQRLLKPTSKKRTKYDNAIWLSRLHNDIDEMDWEMNLEIQEEKMRLKGINEYINFPGFCDDWDNNSHAI